MSQYSTIMEMLDRYNNGEIDLTDQEANLLAMQAQRVGGKFRVENKPLSKGAFDAADMATFGLLPNEWRPTSQGQDVMGETGLDRFAGGVGSIAGLVGGAAGATKASKAGWEAIKKTFAKKKADNIATNIYKGNLLGQGSGPPLRLGRGTPQLGGRPLGLPGPGVGRPGQLPGPGVGRQGQLSKPPYRSGDTQQMLDDMRRRGMPAGARANRGQELQDAINALRNNPEILRALGVQQGGYIGMQEGGDVINAAGGPLVSDDDYQAHLLAQARLLGHEGPWSGTVEDVTTTNLESRNNQITRDDFESNTYSTEEGAPQGTWIHQSEKDGVVKDFIQPMLPAVNVRG